MRAQMCKNAAESQECLMRGSGLMRPSLLYLAGMFLAMGLTSPAGAEIRLGEPLPPVVLEAENGGQLDGSSWHSDSLKGVLHILMYVDPDEVKVNLHVEDALSRQNFDPEKVRSVAVINMAATWKPNFAIDIILKGKQEKYPDTLYLRDLQGELVNKWGLMDNSYHVLLVGRQGEVLFSAGDALSEEQVTQLISIITASLAGD